MSILKIARMGHPVLNQTAQRVSHPSDPAVQRLIADMIETMEDAGGTGLAAPQVHEGLRIMVFFVSGRRAGAEAKRLGYDQDDLPATAAVPLTVLINPEFEILDGHLEEGWEGCLSIPELMGQVPRPARIRYRGITAEGEELVREAAGFHARVFLHEYDHLDGILYPERMTDLKKLIFSSEIAYYQENV
ncbi:peptide deformylase [Kiloniella sp. b19]|uniref:peptide deformylase n=1 Tax=Kiloniella sp. GXU_MW_B19 TaxID=3141326 RepID=UPI0031DB835C